MWDSEPLGLHNIKAKNEAAPTQELSLPSLPSLETITGFAVLSIHSLNKTPSVRTPTVLFFETGLKLTMEPMLASNSW